MASEPLRYGIIGAGMMGGEHALDLARLPGAEVVALADPVAASLEWTTACVGHRVDTYDDHRGLIERDDLDVVIIATPNDTHRRILDDVLATDVAVLVEKPMCTTVADCLEVRRLAQGRDAMTWVGLEYRYIPVVAALIEQVRSGAVGSVRMVSIREHRFPFLTKVGDWNRFNERTGGTLVEKCCHFFDLMRLLAGSDPVRILASGGQAVNHLDECYDGRVPDIWDHAYVIVEFANGVRGCLDLSMFAEGGRHEQEICVVGDRAKIEADFPGVDTIWLGPRDRSGPIEIPAPTPDEVPYPELHGGASYLEHVAMARCLREGLGPEVTVDDGLWSVAVGVAAQRAVGQARVVTLEEVWS